jgi:NAD(P)-dependent dehydrogenase (short-subunit alcohol dehydrogenase family)
MAYALEGMTALVTGGGGGIGSASAAFLARDGAAVLIAGRTESSLKESAAHANELAAGGPGSCRYVVADALEEDVVIDLVARAAEPTGRIDMAVGVVGGGGSAPAKLLDSTVEIVESTYRRNVTGTFLLIKYAGGAMVTSGGGSIVAISSMQAAQTAPYLAPYCASKAGLEMLCRTAADELGNDRVRVNMVRPGLTQNGQPSHLSNNDRVLAAYMEQQPIDRPGQTEDIAGAVRYLAGPESSWVTGTFILVDGGATIRRFPDLTFWWERDR